MAYNDTPLANEAKSASQPKIRNNFNVLQSFLALNHENPNVGTGKHSYVTLPTHAAPGSLGGEIALYTKLLGGLPQLFLQKNGVADEIPLAALLSTGNPGYAVIGGLKLRWGWVNPAAALQLVDINLGVAAEAKFTAVPLVIVSRQHDHGGGSIDDVDRDRNVYVVSTAIVGAAANVTVQGYGTRSGNQHIVQFNYFAIGI
jgi:hypothetical protein